MKDLYRLKGKSIESNVQPSQDNREDMVKKLEKGSTVTCSKCHKESHKSNKCPQPRKKLPDEKNKKKLTIKSSLIYTKPNRRNKSNSTSYVVKQKTKARWLLTRLGRRKGVGTTSFGCPRTSSPTWRGLKWCGFQRRLEAQDWLRGIWRLGKVWGAWVGMHHAKIKESQVMD